ncbi:unnamed protein product [Echinostoma caproni]|uniref:NR LBD domain-containing protein n=1 Tax=Echinostoma caproni TaxID=27848 RepID=A0A183AXY2_9TREM|nr:unnamed protein product [Echinostoma caproni]
MSTIGPDNQDLSDTVGDHESGDETIEIRNIFESSPDTPVFPITSLNTLNNCLNQSKWVVPVLPDTELEILIKATIAFAKQGKDEESKHCRRFCRYGLLSSFQKTFLDEALEGWACQILHYIYMNALLAVELCAIKARDDSISILDLESVLFNPDTK